MDINKFWFNNFKPDVEIMISNSSVSVLMKKMVMESELGIKGQFLYDPIVSKILQANVHYIGLGKKKQLINLINKKCNHNINPYVLNLKVEIDNEVFILVESKEFSHRDLTNHRVQAQFYYEFRNNYLNNNKFREPSEFIREYFITIADNLTNFLEKRA